MKYSFDLFQKLNDCNDTNLFGEELSACNGGGPLTPHNGKHSASGSSDTPSKRMKIS